MIVRLALRSLAVRPIRTAVLACGFGLGIAVMAALLGVGDVILEQARSPELQGGGDMLVTGAFGVVENAPFVLSSVRELVRTASPARRSTIYLMNRGEPMPIVARGGVPSLEKSVGDPEVKDIAAWTDALSDARWTHVNPGAVLRGLDRFHAQPNVPEFASSWAEWLYFNGRTPDGRLRFYLTFIVGPTIRPGIRSAGVHLQLDRNGKPTNYLATGEVDERELLDHAPDLDISGNHVRLAGQRYEMTLQMPGVHGSLTLDPSPGRSLPPAVLRGARGWESGYVVPVLSGKLAGTLTTGSEAMAFDGAEGYHDHNWGFWRDVTWQWGQVSGDGLSFIYGRVFPPADVAALDRVPGFLGVLDEHGLIAVATDVSIVEHRPDGRLSGAPTELDVTARASAVDLRLSFLTDRAVRRPLSMTGGQADFLQLGGTYRVQGWASGRTINVSARGAAETFQQR
jgi:hypothetical protein